MIIPNSGHPRSVTQRHSLQRLALMNDRKNKADENDRNKAEQKVKNPGETGDKTLECRKPVGRCQHAVIRHRNPHQVIAPVDETTPSGNSVKFQTQLDGRGKIPDNSEAVPSLALNGLTILQSSYPLKGILLNKNERRHIAFTQQVKDVEGCCDEAMFDALEHWNLVF